MNARRAEQRKVVPVPMAVVLHAVTAGDDLTGERGMRLSTLGNAEEGRTDAVPVEQVEHGWGDGRIGAVVDRQGDLSARD